MVKKEKIDFSADRLISVAANLVDNHKYLEALKMLNKNRELNGDDEDSLMLYAEIFDDIGQYEQCINGWFRYLDATMESDLAEAYEGLAVAYLNLGNEHFAAYYYRLMLMETDGIDAAAREEILDNFMQTERNPLHFVWPPRLADYSNEIASGVELMKKSEYEAAIKEFDKVDENNEKYPAARNYIAMCNIICDKLDEAEEECNKILAKYNNNIQALTTLVAVKTEQQKKDESRILAEKLLTFEVTEPEDIYKIATVCCENGMHEEAYSLFCRLGEEFDFDISVLYFKAVAAYNAGKYKESYAEFDKILTVYPHSVVAKYTYTAARQAEEEGKIEELSYFYRLPPHEREATLKILAAVSSLPASQFKKIFSKIDITTCLEWCFDEVEARNESELHTIAADCAVRAGLDSFVREKLLNALLPDTLKISILTRLCERNEENEFGVVFCNLYKCVTTRKIHIDRIKRKAFVRAYSHVFARFSIMDDNYGLRLATAAEEIYSGLKASLMLSIVNDINALCAAMYVTSGIHEDSIEEDKIAEFFGTEQAKIDRILKYVF